MPTYDYRDILDEVQRMREREAKDRNAPAQPFAQPPPAKAPARAERPSSERNYFVGYPGAAGAQKPTQEEPDRHYEGGRPAGAAPEHRPADSRAAQGYYREPQPPPPDKSAVMPQGSYPANNGNYPENNANNGYGRGYNDNGSQRGNGYNQADEGYAPRAGQYIFGGNKNTQDDSGYYPSTGDSAYRAEHRPEGGGYYAPPQSQSPAPRYSGETADNGYYRQPQSDGYNGRYYSGGQRDGGYYRPEEQGYYAPSGYSQQSSPREGYLEPRYQREQREEQPPQYGYREGQGYYQDRYQDTAAKPQNADRQQYRGQGYNEQGREPQFEDNGYKQSYNRQPQGYRDYKQPSPHNQQPPGGQGYGQPQGEGYGSRQPQGYQNGYPAGAQGFGGYDQYRQESGRGAAGGAYGGYGQPPVPAQGAGNAPPPFRGDRAQPDMPPGNTENLRQDRRRINSMPPIPPEHIISPPIAPRTLKPSMSELMQNFGEGVGLGKGMDSLPAVMPRKNVPVMGEVNYEQEQHVITDPSDIGRVIGQAFGQAFSQATGGTHEDGNGFTFSFSQMTGEFTRPKEFDTFTQKIFAPAETAEHELITEQHLNESAKAGMGRVEQEIAAGARQEPMLPEAAEPLSDEAGVDPGTEAAAAPEAADDLADGYTARMPVGRVPLNPEDTGDDIDYDTDGGVIDASMGEEERRAVITDIKKVRLGLKFRFGATLAIFLIVLYMTMSIADGSLLMPTFMFPTDETAWVFLSVYVGLIAASMLINSSTIGGGLVSLVTLKADNDSLVSLALVASVVQGVALIMSPESLYAEGVQLYGVLPVLGLLFNIVGRMMMMKRIAKNSKLALSDSEKYVLRTIKSEDFSRELSRGLPNNLAEITYSVKTKYTASFLKSSYAPDFSEGVNRILSLLVLLSSIVVAGVSFFINGSVYVSLTVFAGILAVCSPLTAAIVGNLPMLRASLKLSRIGAAITGYPVVEEYSGVRAAAFKAKELFPGESISMVGMRVFKESLIEQAICDACSVISATDSPLAPLFKGMVESEKILKPAENIVFEDAMGLSAWVGGKRVLVGNKKLMQNHSVSVPDDGSSRYMDSPDTIYLSNSGEVIAMFTLNYTVNEAVKRQLMELSQNRVALIVHSTDPNITPERIASMFSYPPTLVKMVPAALYADFDKISAPRNRVRSTIIYTGSIMSMFRAIGMISRIKTSVTIGTALQLVSMLIGYAVVTFFAFFAGMSHVPYYMLLIYQAVCALIVIVASNARKI